MLYKKKYITPEGFSDLLMCSDGEFLTGLWFEHSKDEEKHLTHYEEKELLIFEETAKWLDIYFKGQVPSFTPKYKIKDLTDFRKEVLEIMIKIPYGQVITYGDIAKKIADKKGIKRMSSQAVGGAVGWNPIGIIIPCHRVVGANNNLVGYGGGLSNKISLLAHEGIDLKNK